MYMLFLFCCASYFPVITSTTVSAIGCWHWHEQVEPLARELGCLTSDQIMLLTSDTFYRDKMEQFNCKFNSNLDWEEMQKIKSTLKSLILDIMCGKKDTKNIDDNKYPQSFYEICRALLAYRDNQERAFLSGR
jgi:hypothetical protein